MKLELDLELDDDFHSVDLDVPDEVGARCRFGTRFYCRKIDFKKSSPYPTLFDLDFPYIKNEINFSRKSKTTKFHT